MDHFVTFDGRSLAYLDVGDGPVVLLHHGFAADHDVNWLRPGVIDALVDVGRRVIAIDARGHGSSDKPHDPAAYGEGAMARDVQALLDHLAIERCAFVGYSMGSFIGATVAPVEPRIERLVLGGVGEMMLEPGRGGALDSVAEALEADDPSPFPRTARAFRRLADSTGADRLALAAHRRAVHDRARPPLEAITVPTLVLAGDDDHLVGPPEPLAAAIAGATAARVGGDHLSAVADPGFIPAIVAFCTAV